MDSPDPANSPKFEEVRFSSPSLFLLPRTVLFGLLSLGLWLCPAKIWAQTTRLQILPGSASPSLESTHRHPGRLFEIHWSPNLLQWSPFATVHAELAPYPVSLTDHGKGFYRLETRASEINDDWTNQLDLDGALFFADAFPASTPFVKFTFPLQDPSRRVFFQDSQTYPFHYHFIVARLPGRESLTLTQFENIALRRAEQELLVGTVLLAPDPSVKEAAIQFAGRDPYPVNQVADWFETIQSRLTASAQTPWRFFYMPSFEQREITFANESFFNSRQIRVDSAARWLTSNTCYAPGWAFGRLVFVPGDEIHAAYGDGRLTNTDILLTDAVPAEIPIVAGVVTLTPATPNSHVALLTRSLGLPFAFASGDAMQEQLRSLDGLEILLVVSQEDGAEAGDCAIDATDTTGRLSAEERQGILDLKKPPAPEIQPKREAGSLVLAVDALTPDAIDLVGGKAANFGLLRQSIPEHSPSPVMAITFDLWDAFLRQPFDHQDPGKTLGDAIDDRLRGFAYPPDLSLLRPALDDVRTWIKERGQFTATQQSELLQTLSPFDPARKLRFRSSTNVEDSEAFSGAGLYDSFSGCLADDLDADASGPSHCNPSKEDERGIFRAIRKVYASFYNENAYVERLRHGIPEADVGMAILVHHSFPDERELANGVATLEITYDEGGTRQLHADLVTQLGAESVTNPDAAKQPEIVIISGVEEPQLKQPSSLAGEGTVMTWPDDYEDLYVLIGTAAQAYESATSSPGRSIVLDFEYKKMKPGSLVVKQIRTVPQPSPVPPPTLPF